MRTAVAGLGLDGFVVPLTDEHLSEYVGDYAKRLEWLTGFSGSAGTAVVLANAAALFTDGRYTLQVRDEVAEDWTLLSVPTESPAAWLGRHAPEGGRIGYDPWLHPKPWVAATETALAQRQATLVPVAANPIDPIWTDRPLPSPEPMVSYDEALAGRSSAQKRQEIADLLTRENLAATVVSALDSVAWVLNVRGRDVAHTPVALAWAMVHADATADLFVDTHKLSEDVRQHLGNAVRIRDASEFPAALAILSGKRVAVDPERTVAAVHDLLEGAGAEVVSLRDPIVLAKAVKNPVEQAGQRTAQVRDGVALTRFLHWLSAEAPGGTLTERAAADKLRAFREETGLLRDLAFETIAGSGPNGAIVHYRVTPESNRVIAPGSVFLCDSGGQFEDGTTDVTRTIWVGPGVPPTELCDRFTRVLKGHIAIAQAVFPRGARGSQIDGFARASLWAAGLDYPHGTGHGVGSFLSVHEGPQRIAAANYAATGWDEPLQAGMLLSNEPGYYKPGHYGIRIENLVLVEERVIDGGDAAMLGFETLTHAPIDRVLVDPRLLNAEERSWLDAYHRRVVARVAPGLDEAALAWLHQACAPL